MRRGGPETPTIINDNDILKAPIPTNGNGHGVVGQNGRLRQDVRKMLQRTPTPGSTKREGYHTGWQRLAERTQQIRGNDIPINNSRLSIGEIFNPQEPEMRVSMLDPENVGNMELIGDAVNYWFGPHWRVVAYHANIESPYAVEREVNKKVSYLDQKLKNGLPDVELNEAEREYDKRHQEQMKNDKRKAYIKVNRWFNNKSQQYFEPQGMTPQKFVEEQMDHANEAHDLVARTALSRFPGITSQLNEIGLQLSSPAEIVEYMASPNVHPRLKYEIQKQLVLTYIAATIEAAEQKDQSRKRLQNIHKLLSRELFAGLIGETEDTWVTSYHDEGTNTVRYINGISGPPLKRRLPGTKNMNTPLRVRRLQDFDFQVYTNPRKKRMDAGTLKGIRKSIKERLNNNDAILNPALDVLDRRGLKFAVLATPEEADMFLDRFQQILLAPKNQYILAEQNEAGEPVFEEPDIDSKGNPKLDADGDPYTWDEIEDASGRKYKQKRKKYKGRVMRILDDSETNTSNDNSNADEVLLFRRVQIYQSDSDTPIEAIVMDTEQFLNYEYEVGNRVKIEPDEKRKIRRRIHRPRYRYTGRGHLPYQHDRTRDVLFEILPQQEYGDSAGIDIGREADRSYDDDAAHALRQTLGKIK